MLGVMRRGIGELLVLCLEGGGREVPLGKGRGREGVLRRLGKSTAGRTAHVRRELLRVVEGGRGFRRRGGRVLLRSMLLRIPLLLLLEVALLLILQLLLRGEGRAAVGCDEWWWVLRWSVVGEVMRRHAASSDDE